MSVDDIYKYLHTCQYLHYLPVSRCVDVYQKIDMRTQTYDVPPQEVSSLAVAAAMILTSPVQILTKDSVTVFVNAIMYYKVKALYCTILCTVLYCTTGEGRHLRHCQRGRLLGLSPAPGRHHAQVE